MIVRLVSLVVGLIALLHPYYAKAQWQAVLSGSKYWPVTVFTAPAGVWAGLTQEEATGLYAPIPTLAFSTDEGQRWNFIGSPSGYSDAPPRTMAQLTGRLLAASAQGVHTSTDDGRTWRTLQTGFPYNALTQLVAGGQRFYATRPGSEGAVLVSADGGQNWQINPVRELRSIAYRQDSLYACTYSTVLVSADHGQSWTKLLDGVYDIQQLAVTSTGSLLVSSQNGLYLSDPAHQRWQKVTLTTRSGTPEAASVQLVAASPRVWLATTARSRNVYASTDQGKTWHDVSTGLPTNRQQPNYTITALAVSEQSVYAVFGQSVWRRGIDELRPDYLNFPDSLVATSTPRDQTLLRWRDNTPNETGFRLERSVSESGNFDELAILPANTIQYVDTAVINGQTYRYRLQTLVQEKRSAYSPVLTVSRPARSCQSINRVMGVDFSDVQLVGPGRAYLLEQSYAGSYQQQLLQTQDSGRSWQPIMPRLGIDNFTSIFFNGPNRGFVSSGSGRLLLTRDGGQSWQTVLTDKASLTSPQFLDEQTGYVISQRGQFYTTNDGGESWTGRASGFNEPTSIWFVSRLIGYVTANNTVSRTTNGGVSWSPVLVDPQPYARFSKVWFRNASLGFALGRGILFRTTNGGEHWTQLTISSRSLLLMDIKQNARQALFVSGLYPGPSQSTGDGSFLFRSVDDGVTWDSVAVPSRGVFTRMAFWG
ncbi:hypothetical protein GCM10027578_27670 [Spirosoma luteolum]